VIAALIWARFLFAVILLGLVGLFVWTACRVEAEQERPAAGRKQR
jgi:hypothetical protein